jgi:hypothetical protein
MGLLPPLAGERGLFALGGDGLERVVLELV